MLVLAAGKGKRKKGGKAAASKQKRQKTSLAAIAAKGEAAAAAAASAHSVAGSLADKQKVRVFLLHQRCSICLLQVLTDCGLTARHARVHVVLLR